MTNISSVSTTFPSLSFLSSPLSFPWLSFLSSPLSFLLTVLSVQSFFELFFILFHFLNSTFFSSTLFSSSEVDEEEIIWFFFFLLLPFLSFPLSFLSLLGVSFILFTFSLTSPFSLSFTISLNFFNFCWALNLSMKSFHLWAVSFLMFSPCSRNTLSKLSLSLSSLSLLWILPPSLPLESCSRGFLYLSSSSSLSSLSSPSSSNFLLYSSLRFLSLLHLPSFSSLSVVELFIRSSTSTSQSLVCSVLWTPRPLVPILPSPPWPFCPLTHISPVLSSFSSICPLFPPPTSSESSLNSSALYNSAISLFLKIEKLYLLFFLRTPSLTLTR